MAIIKLVEACSKIGSGATPRGGKKAYCEDGISLIRSQNVLDFDFSENGLAHINEEQAEKLKNAEVMEEDVLLNITGDSVARTTMMKREFLPARVNQHVAIIRAKKEIIEPSYILYFLQQQKSYLLQLASAGATRNALTKSMIENLELDLPTLEIQRKVVSILDNIQKKIIINRKINENLEQQARTLYSAWFENFIPFAGKIPSDWKVGVLGDIAKISTTSFNPTKNPGTKLEHYSIPAFDERRFPVFETSDDIKSNKYILSSTSVLASKLNPETKRIWRPLCITSHAVCSTEFIVFEAAQSEIKDFVYSIIDSNRFSNWMCAHTTGSTNSRQRTTPAKTLEFKISIPPEKVIAEFCQMVTPMYDLIAENSKENQRLVKLRATLLPKLMSNEIDISVLDF